jgi:chloramphenicol O-acetyltransferase
MAYETHVDIDEVTASYVLTVSGKKSIYELDIEEINDLLAFVDNSINDVERLVIPEFVQTLQDLRSLNIRK